MIEKKGKRNELKHAKQEKKTQRERLTERYIDIIIPCFTQKRNTTNKNNNNEKEPS